MKINAVLATVLLLQLSAAAPAPGNAAIAACDCHHNADAGRWNDNLEPVGRLSALCDNGGGCYQAKTGRMCVAGDLGKCGCAEQAAQDWQSWHGDWFLWSAMTCGGLSITITSL